jgi:hypothetical protein
MSTAKVRAKTKSRASNPSKPSKTASKAKAPSKKVAAKAGADWRGEMLDRMRALIMQAAPEMTEERKWVKPTKPLGVPVWSHNGMVCTGESYTKVVKLTFARGASLPDPTRLFNSSLEGGTRRAIDLPEGTKINERAFKTLVKAAVALNLAAKKR